MSSREWECFYFPCDFELPAHTRYSTSWLGVVQPSCQELSVGRSSIKWSCDNNVPVGEPVVVTILVSTAGLALDSCKHCWVKIVGWSLKEILFPCSCYVMTGLHMSFSQVTFIALLSTVKTSSCPLCLCWSLS